MSVIGEALDLLVDALDVALPDVPVTRDPQVVRAGLASAGVCVFVRPPTVAGRTAGGLQLDVPVSIVLPATDSLADHERAYALLDQLLHLTGQNQTTRPPVPLGADLNPAHTVTVRIGA